MVEFLPKIPKDNNQTLPGGNKSPPTTSTAGDSVVVVGLIFLGLTLGFSSRSKFKLVIFVNSQQHTVSSVDLFLGETVE